MAVLNFLKTHVTVTTGRQNRFGALGTDDGDAVEKEFGFTFQN